VKQLRETSRQTSRILDITCYIGERECFDMSLTRLADDIIAPFVTYRCTMYHRCIASCRRKWVTRYHMHFPGVPHTLRVPLELFYFLLSCVYWYRYHSCR